MRFMMLVKSDAKSEAGVGPDQKMLTDIGAYTEGLMNSGALIAAEGLQPSSKAARVRMSGGKLTVIDGPFAEARELVGGFWTIRAQSKADAIEIAKRVPNRDCEIELRQVFELEDFPVDPTEQPQGWRENEQRYRDAQESPAAVAPARKPGTKRYVVWIKSDKNTEGGVMPNERVLAAMGALMEETIKAGDLLGGDGLQASSKGARVIAKAGKRTVVDGPFTEAKELVAGYSMIQAKSKADAVEWAKRMLKIHVEYTDITEGEVEVRQVYDLEDFPVSPEEKPDGWRQREQQLRERLGQ